MIVQQDNHFKQLYISTSYAAVSFPTSGNIPKVLERNW